MQQQKNARKTYAQTNTLLSSPHFNSREILKDRSACEFSKIKSFEREVFASVFVKSNTLKLNLINMIKLVLVFDVLGTKYNDWYFVVNCTFPLFLL